MIKVKGPKKAETCRTCEFWKKQYCIFTNKNIPYNDSDKLDEDCPVEDCKDEK